MENKKNIYTIDQIIKLGERYVYPENIIAWRQMTKIMSKGKRHMNKVVLLTVKIMCQLEAANNLEAAKETLDKETDIKIKSRVEELIIGFAKKGPEFWEYAADNSRKTPEAIKWVEYQKKINKRLESKYKNNAINAQNSNIKKHYDVHPQPNNTKTENSNTSKQRPNFRNDNLINFMNSSQNMSVKNQRNNNYYRNER